jgi:hypothetical protein
MFRTANVIQKKSQYRALSRSCSRIHLHWSAAAATSCLFLYTTSSRAMSTSVTSGQSCNARTIAVGQVCSTSSKWENLLNAAMCAGWSSNLDCSMLFLPECFGFLGVSAEQTLRAAEPPTPKSNPSFVTESLTKFVQDCSMLATNEIPSALPSIDVSKIDERDLSLVDGIQAIAKASNLWISAGSIHVAAATDDDSRVYNTHFIVDNTGTIRAEYRKIHLFDVCIPGKVDLLESKTTCAGIELVTCPDSPIGTIFGGGQRIGIVLKTTSLTALVFCP